MRSYRQFCAIAKALDAIGDRWTLLIVRELLLRGSARYGDLQRGLPNIATNLLAERLRDLEQNGVVRRTARESPNVAESYELTLRGRALEPVLHELGRWGAPLLATAPRSNSFRVHWLAFPARLYLTDNSPDAPPVSLEVQSGNHAVTFEAAGTVSIRLGRTDSPDAVLSGPPQLLLDVLTGKKSLNALPKTVRYEGDPAVLHRLVRAAK